MAYDQATLPATGDGVAIDKISGVDFQRVKTVLGGEGSAADAVGGAGAVAAGVQRVTLASDDPAVTALATLHTDLATTLASYVDGLEALIGTSNSSLSSILTALTSTIAGYVDGLETLVTGSNTKLDTIHTDLGTTLAGLLTDLKGYTDQLEGYVDGVETLITSTNTKLDTLHTDIATTLSAYVDGLEGILGTTSGAAVTTDANGTVQQYLRGLIVQWIAGTLKLGAGTNLIGKVKTKFIVAAASAYTRPANTTPYTANDAVSNNATIASVTAISLSLSDVNDDTITLERIRVMSTDTGVAGKAFRVWLFNSDPTANSGVQGGDNLAWSQKQAGFIGSMSGTFRAFQDGSGAVCVPDEGSRIITTPVSGAKTIFALLQTLNDFTPSANSTTFTLTAEGFQGAA
jgi:hypothetical protein